MNRGHWTEQEFIDHIYGIGPADDHLKECAECRDRHSTLAARRQLVTAEPDVPLEFLAAQRRAIHRRLDQPARSMRMVPAFAATLVLLAGFFAIRQTPQPAQPQPAAAASDTQLFADIYALEQSSEPRAAGAVRALFEEN